MASMLKDDNRAKSNTSEPVTSPVPWLHDTLPLKSSGSSLDMVSSSLGTEQVKSSESEAGSSTSNELFASKNVAKRPFPFDDKQETMQRLLNHSRPTHHYCNGSHKDFDNISAQSSEYASSHTLSARSLDYEDEEPFLQVDEDEYGSNEALDQAILHMSDSFESPDHTQVTLSSVLEHWDHDSTSAGEYDPDLQHSRQASSEAENVRQASKTPLSLLNTEDLLDEDVDWDSVLSISQNIAEDPPLVGDSQPRASKLPGDDTKNSIGYPHGLQVDESGSAPLKRPPFPRTVSDESFIPTASGKTLLRTFFRIGHLIKEANESPVIEFYAKVLYSARETMAQKQHFQFADIFDDRHPHPSGTLSGWRTGSSLERQSYVFISTRHPKLCRCIGKMKQDKKASCGWTVDIIRVYEVTFEDIWAANSELRRTYGEDEPGESTSAVQL
ncbi:hypothetical protein E8E14_009949 [Neopestalotiopsis sp. 37M]|nr:hypothetical protein E8E14_009949 [Neopestalotiopsis sp. 37M]